MQQFLDVISPRKKGLAFLLHKRNLSDDTLGFRISVAWRRTIWSLHQPGDKMQLGHGQQNATDGISDMCHIFRFLSDKIWHKGLRVLFYFLEKSVPITWFLMYFKHLCLHLGLIFHKSHSVFCIVLTFYSKTGRWSIVTPVTQWDLVHAEPKLRDKWPNCQVAFTLHCTKYTNT